MSVHVRANVCGRSISATSLPMSPEVTGGVGLGRDVRSSQPAGRRELRRRRAPEGGRYAQRRVCLRMPVSTSANALTGCGSGRCAADGGPWPEPLPASLERRVKVATDSVRGNRPRVSTMKRDRGCQSGALVGCTRSVPSNPVARAPPAPPSPAPRVLRHRPHDRRRAGSPRTREARRSSQEARASELVAAHPTGEVRRASGQFSSGSGWGRQSPPVVPSRRQSRTKRQAPCELTFR